MITSGTLCFDRDLEVGVDARIGLVDDQVDAVRRRRLAAVGREPRLDLVEPGLVAFGRALVERREGADQPGPAGLDHQVGPGDQEHRRGDRGQGQAALQGVR